MQPRSPNYHEMENLRPGRERQKQKRGDYRSRSQDRHRLHERVNLLFFELRPEDRAQMMRADQLIYRRAQ
ncbi:hypothetical protein GCM10007937_09220 [Mesorhizobium albiziae]|nr:hypothetical protein GCM10007937_09220 [Mesorhizobium albiziae]